MPGQIDTRLAELGITLPTPSTPRANYIPWVRTGNLVYIAGQVPFEGDGLKFIGKVGREFSVEEGQAAARLVAVNILAHLRVACEGDLDRVEQVVKLNGFVNCVPEFGDQPKVINGCSNLLGDVFGERGRHARAALGVASLPFGVAVEIDGVFAIAP